MSDESEILLGCWDCSSCSTRGVPGDVYRCSSCGAGRPDDVEFYLPSDAKVIRDRAGVAAAKAGADWLCEYCQQWVTATLSKCPNCAGGEVGGAKRHQAAGELAQPASRPQPARAATIPLPLPTPAVRLAATPATPAAAPAARAKRATMPAAACTALAVFGALSLALVLWLVFRSTNAIATVTGHSWTRVQHVEEYKTVAQEGWDCPADAFGVKSERREHHKDKIVDHYETRYRTVHDRVADGTERVKTGTKTVNLGNGRFKREPTYSTRTKYKTVSRQEPYSDPVYRYDPVYRTYYFYLVNRWVLAAPRTASGNDLNPQWPPTAVRDAQQRMAAREESYTLALTERGQKAGEQPRTWAHALDETAWRSWPDGATVVLTLRLGNVIGIAAAEQ